MLSKMASAAPESLTIQKQITESLQTSQCSGKKKQTSDQSGCATVPLVHIDRAPSSLALVEQPIHFATQLQPHKHKVEEMDPLIHLM